MNIFEEANDLLGNFIFNHLDSYHQLRNYDYGIKTGVIFLRFLNIHLTESFPLNSY